MKKIFIFTFAISLCLFLNSCKKDIEGCMDSAAKNFNAEATTDDGSCEYAVQGCTDPEAQNYNANAEVEDNSCTYLASTETQKTNSNY